MPIASGNAEQVAIVMATGSDPGPKTFSAALSTGSGPKTD